MQLTMDSAADHIGEEVALTDWITITQEMVDGFAGATLDPDWMHVDVERSRRESPFGGTIVQGFPDVEPRDLLLAPLPDHPRRLRLRPELRESTAPGT